MSILAKYVFREVIIFVGAALMTFTGILFTVQVLRTSDMIISKGVSGDQVLRVFAAIVPTFLELAVPLAVLIGVMLAFARMSGDSEIVVIRASGVSLRQLLRSLFAFSFIAFGAAVAVSMYAKPWGYRTLSDTLFEIAHSKTTASLDAGVFSELGAVSIYAEHIDHRRGLLRRVLIHDRRSEEQAQIIFADRGRIASRPGEQEILLVLEEGSAHEIGEGTYSVTDFDSNRLGISAAELYPEGRDGSMRARELTMSELRAELAVRQLELQTATENEEDIAERRLALITELEQRFATPFATLLFVFLAMPLGVQPPRAQRTWGLSLSVGIALIVFLLYFGVLSLGLALAQAGSLSPRVAVWTPNVLTLIATLYCVRQMSSERWQSIGQGLSDIASRILKPFSLGRGAS